MASVSSISRILVAKPRISNMSVTHRMVSPTELDSEWQEIQAAQSNPALFRPLYTRYYEPIFRFIHRRINEENLAADICSNTFLKAMEKLNSYVNKGVPFSAWLFRIASNEVAQYYRNHVKNRVVSTDEYNLHDIVVEMEEEDNEALREKLLQKLNDLKEKDLQIIEMRYFEKRPFKEIAQILDITESNAKVRIYRVIDRLKKLMKP